MRQPWAEKQVRMKGEKVIIASYYSSTSNENTLQSPWSRVCGQYCLLYALHRSRNIPMSTIVNMFTDHKDRNDTLVRNFIRKWYFV